MILNIPYEMINLISAVGFGWMLGRALHLRRQHREIRALTERIEELTGHLETYQRFSCLLARRSL